VLALKDGSAAFAGPVDQFDAAMLKELYA
jgi:hypothetical protein